MCVVQALSMSGRMYRDPLTHDGGLYHIETSLLICNANQ